MLHVSQLILHTTTVTTMASTTLVDDRSIAKNGRKSMLSCLDLLHILQLVLHSMTVTAMARTTPCHDRSVAKKGSKSLRYPSPMMAAKAREVD